MCCNYVSTLPKISESHACHMMFISWVCMVREIIGKLAKTACSFFLDARKWRGRLCRRFYYWNGRPANTIAPLQARSFSFTVKFRFALLEREFWKHHRRKRQEDRQKIEIFEHLPIVSLFGIKLSVNVKESCMFNCLLANNFLIFTSCQNKVYMDKASRF